MATENKNLDESYDQSNINDARGRICLHIVQQMLELLVLLLLLVLLELLVLLI